MRNPEYYKIKSDKAENMKLTMFITSFGRFTFTRLSFGINCAPDYFAQRFSELFYVLKNVIIHMNYVLIHTNTKRKHLELLDYF